MTNHAIIIPKSLKIWGFKINPFNKKIIGVKNLMQNHKKLEEKRKEIF